MAAAHTLMAGRYRLLRQLGAGGMGLVWLARDEMLGRDVAVKEVVPPAGLSEQERHELRYRTLREARTAARLNHPNVVKIYDVVHTEEWPWIVMEFVPSRSLFEIMTEDGPLRPEQAARVGLAMLAALNAAHKAGVLHRDVKPGNVLIAADGRVVLTDFGLATFDGTESAVTVPGLVLGSAQYVAPERAKDGTSTPESDLWSLGATLYAAVEGRSPYARSSTYATLTALATAQPDRPRRAGPLRPVLSGLLRRNPKDRLAPPEVQRLLQKVAGEPVTRRRTARPGRRPLLVGLAAALLLAAAGVALVAGRPDGGGAVAASGRPSSSGPTSHGAALAGPSTGPGAAAGPLLGTAACGTATGAPVVAAAARPGWPALPDGWVWYLDPTGFRLAVPAGWTLASGPAGLCFREPGGGRELGVEPYRPLVDPVTRWRAQESALTDPTRPEGYQLVGITAVDYYTAGAEWEYRYDGPDGTPAHGIARCFITAPGQAYTLAWRTDEFDWPPQQANWRLVIGSFAPPPGG